MAVSLSLANHHASLPVAWRLYLPKEWAVDHERRRKVGVPDEKISKRSRDRARADRNGLKSRAFSRRGPDGRGLRLQHKSAFRHQQRSASVVIDEERSNPFSAALRRKAYGCFRLDADPLPHCDLGSKNSFYPGFTFTEKPKSAPRLSKDALKKLMGIASPSESGRSSSKTTTRVILTGLSSSGIKSSSRPTLMAEWVERGGPALLAGLLTCGRCGRRLTVSYSGRTPGQRVYRCDRPNLMLGHARHTLTTRGGVGSTPPNFAGIKG